MPHPEFLIASLVVILVPGTGTLFTVTTALSRGRAAGVVASAGCTLGILPHLLATVLGLATLVQAHPPIVDALKVTGAAYLLYLAWATGRDTTLLAVERPATAAGPLGVVVQAVLINLLNPKLTIFFLAFLPQFVEPGSTAPLADLSRLGAVFMVLTFLVFALYGCVADAFRQSVIQSERLQRWLRWAFAAAFAGLALRLAVSA
jgi:threonine/homoserine/homoserine lactone efflux protein